MEQWRQSEMNSKRNSQMQRTSESGRKSSNTEMKNSEVTIGKFNTISQNNIARSNPKVGGMSILQKSNAQM